MNPEEKKSVSKQQSNIAQKRAEQLGMDSNERKKKLAVLRTQKSKALKDARKKLPVRA